MVLAFLVGNNLQCFMNYASKTVDSRLSRAKLCECDGLEPVAKWPRLEFSSARSI